MGGVRLPLWNDPAKLLDIGRRYTAGETLKTIAEHFGCGHETDKARLA